MWRQGDVLIKKVEAVPDGAEKRTDTVLAEGELTGHRHRVEDQATAEVFEDPYGTLFLRVIADQARVVHEEHGPIELETGVYRVWRQREYSPHGDVDVMD